MTRCVFIKRMALAGAGLLLPGGAAAWSTKVEPNWIEIKRVALSIRGLHPAFENLTLAHISDIHVSSWMTQPRLHHIVKKVNALRPDIIAITGDFVSRRQQGQQQILTQTLKTLEPKIEAFAVMGITIIGLISTL